MSRLRITLELDDLPPDGSSMEFYVWPNKTMIHVAGLQSQRLRFWERWAMSILMRRALPVRIIDLNVSEPKPEP